jgi:hypothetical protein
MRLGTQHHCPSGRPRSSRRFNSWPKTPACENPPLWSCWPASERSTGSTDTRSSVTPIGAFFSGGSRCREAQYREHPSVSWVMVVGSLVGGLVGWLVGWLVVVGCSQNPLTRGNGALVCECPQVKEPSTHTCTATSSSHQRLRRANMGRESHGSTRGGPLETDLIVAPVAVPLTAHAHAPGRTRARRPDAHRGPARCRPRAAPGSRSARGPLASVPQRPSTRDHFLWRRG